MRRVVVTGLGIVSPLATGIEETWGRLLAGESGAGPITQFDASDLPCCIAFDVQRGDGTHGPLNDDHWPHRKDPPRFLDFNQSSALAAQPDPTAPGPPLHTQPEKISSPTTRVLACRDLRKHRKGGKKKGKD